MYVRSTGTRVDAGRIRGTKVGGVAEQVRISYVQCECEGELGM